MLERDTSPDVTFLRPNAWNAIQKLRKRSDKDQAIGHIVK